MALLSAVSLGFLIAYEIRLHFWFIIAYIFNTVPFLSFHSSARTRIVSEMYNRRREDNYKVYLLYNLPSNINDATVVVMLRKENRFMGESNDICV